MLGKLHWICVHRHDIGEKWIKNRYNQVRRNDFKSGGARFNGLNKVGDKVGILLTRVGYSMIFESFWNTNKWNMVFYVPHSPPNVLNSMSL